MVRTLGEMAFVLTSTTTTMTWPLAVVADGPLRLTACCWPLGSPPV
jgi:hypothetical protein